MLQANEFPSNGIRIEVAPAALHVRRIQPRRAQPSGLTISGTQLLIGFGSGLGLFSLLVWVFVKYVLFEG